MSTPTEQTPNALSVGSAGAGATAAGTAVASTPNATFSGFLKWSGAFAVYALVLFALDENDSYAKVVEAMAWLVAGTAVVHWYKEIGTNLSALTGVNL